MAEMESSAPVTIVGVSTEELARRRERSPSRRESLFGVRDLTVSYAGVPALADVSLEIYKNYITAFIGPSGCGKSTFIRCFNRMNDLIPTASIDGCVMYHGVDLYGPDVDPVEVRRRIGMVFQKPNPFPKSIYDNVAFDPTLLGGYTALPIQIFQWTARPQGDFKLLAAAGIIVLLAILLTMNAFAIWLRNRYQKRW